MTIMRAWMIRSNAHGLTLHTLVYLPDGDKPETKEDWIQTPWLDNICYMEDGDELFLHFDPISKKK